MRAEQGSSHLPGGRGATLRLEPTAFPHERSALMTLTITRNRTALGLLGGAAALPSPPGLARAAGDALRLPGLLDQRRRVHRLLRRHRQGLLQGRGARPHLSLGRARRDPRERAHRRQGRPDADHARHHGQGDRRPGRPFKIIGTQYQKNPIGIVSLAKKPIKTPPDLVGKTLAVPPVNVISVEAMLKLNSIDKAKVNIVPYAYDPTPLIKGEIDASLDFTTNVPFTIKQTGEEAVVVPALRLRLHHLQRHGGGHRGDAEDQAQGARRLAAGSRKGWDGEPRRPGGLAAEIRRHLVQGHRPHDRERDLLQHRAEAADRAAERHLRDGRGGHRRRTSRRSAESASRRRARCSTPRCSPRSDARAGPAAAGIALAGVSKPCRRAASRSRR